jgi:CheY-like chemotaxis protein
VAAEYGVDPAVPPSLVGDGARLRRVVFRLLAGIVGASSDGRMDVGMTTRARPGGEIELRVSVRCSAMDSVDRRDLMGGGTHAAPGPSVAEFIVRRMKGRVRVTAGRGGGARVDLSVVVRSERAAGGGDAGSDLPERALRVLVVDDDALSRKAAVRALRRSRWHADSVADGDAALGALLRDAYDLVLLDMHLARSNGRDVAREIRRRVPAGGPRIVAMTAAPESGDGAAWTAAGLDACVAKPVDADRIRRALRGLPATAEHDVRSPTDIDAAVLDRYRAGRGKARSPLLAELIDDYAADIPGQLDRLREDAARPDAAALRETAHRVAGTSASIGAVGIASLASSMERLAAVGDVGGAAAVLERLVAAWPVVRAALVRERGRR